MKIRVFLLAVAVAAFGWVRLPASTSLMPIGEIKPGMVGTGRTIFEGSEMKDFKVHILGVLKNVQAPQRNLILAKLEGGPLAETGVIAGMSGSPVYIDGRLIGAVSYSIGAFPKEPIAGITPIAEMIEATADTGPRRGTPAQARLELPVSPERLAAAIRANYARVASFADRPADVQAFGLPASTGSQMGALLRPIATPLVLSGMDSATSDLVGSMFREAGFTPMLSGGTGGDVPPETGPLRPGDPVGVSLLGGDSEMGATGTVTHVDGDRVYAFGHPFFNFGPTAFPLTRAHVYATLPSLMSSFKIATMGDVIGTMQQDRATAIAGRLGKGPAVIPVTITLDNGRAKRTFRYTAVNDQLFTPLLTYVALFNTLGNYERQFGAMTFTVKGKASFDRHADLDYEDIFTGDGPIPAASAYVAGPITMLLANDVEPVTLKGVDLAVTTSEESRSATIERVWLDEVRPRAGRTVPLKVLTRSYRGTEKISTIPIEIPANASGQLTVMVTDGKQLNQIEQRELRRSVQPTSVAQMIKALNQSHRNNRVYVRLLTGTPGAVVNGEALTSLPPSVLAVLEGDRNGGNFTPIRSAALGEWELAMDSAISGTRVLTIDLDGRPGRH
jgi:hypothetical protein